MASIPTARRDESFAVLENAMIDVLQRSAPLSSEERLMAARKGAIEALCHHPNIDRAELTRLERVARGQDSGLVIIAYLAGDREQAIRIFEALA